MGNNNNTQYNNGVNELKQVNKDQNKLEGKGCFPQKGENYCDGINRCYAENKISTQTRNDMHENRKAFNVKRHEKW